MSESSLNPYAPPKVAPAASEEHPRYRELLPLWIWLGLAVVISLLGTPADPISRLMALAYGLVSFWVGAVLGLPLNTIVRVISGRHVRQNVVFLGNFPRSGERGYGSETKPRLMGWSTSFSLLLAV